VSGPTSDGDWIAALPLVDHHCHAVVGDDLDDAAFEALLGESGRPAPPGCSGWDTALGLAVRAWCAPVLDLPAGSPAADYLRRRRELGASEVNARMLAGGAHELLVDTGYRSDELVSLDRLGGWAGGTAQEIVRLETVAEDVAGALRTGRAGPDAAAAGYAEALGAALAARVDPVGPPGASSAGAVGPVAAKSVAAEEPKGMSVAAVGRRPVGWKSVAAYRCGLDIDWTRHTPTEVRAAADRWLHAGPGESGGWRLSDPVLIRHGVWCALDTGLPVQFHTGFGDTDARLPASDPTLLSGLIADSVDVGTPIVLLHCWPRHREAGYLAHVWPHVHLDVSLALPHVGRRGPAVLAETLELAPWHKVLYASDAFGLAELFHLGARIHRQALREAVASLADMGMDRAEQERLATLVTAGNARRIYPGLTG
jgi:hypothetical protein